jgi:hypothetical protein
MLTFQYFRIVFASNDYVSLGPRIREVPVLQSLRGWLRFVGCLAIYLSTPLYGQRAAPDLNGPIVFQTNARSVVLEVVVTGRDGQPVEGLQRGDFLLSEDGHPQTITSFEEHTGSPPAQAPLPELPPNIFTNAPRVKPTDSVTILLFDTLNTPPEDLNPLLSFMRPGMPDSTQIQFTLKVQPETSLTGASGAPQTGNEVNKNRARAGDNHKLKGLLTRYTVDFGIPAHDLLFDVASNGGRRGRLESMLVVYARDGKAWNWIRRYFDLHWDAAEYASVQVHGIHFRLQIDVPKSGVYLQSGVYDQLSNETGTLKIPLSGVVTGQAAASKSFAEAPAPSPGVPEGPATPASGTLAVPPNTTTVQTQTASSASLAAVPTIPARGPQGNQARPASGKDVPQAYAKPATYLDDPLQSLKTAVPTLDGLKYDASQDQLPAILARLGQTIDEVLPRLPDLVSREEVIHGARAPVHPISTVLGNLSIEEKSSEEYKYLIICHRAANGATTVEESRTDRSGQPIHPDKLSLLAY